MRSGRDKQPCVLDAERPACQKGQIKKGARMNAKEAMDAAVKEDVNDARASNRRYNELMRRPIIPENMRDDADRQNQMWRS